LFLTNLRFRITRVGSDFLTRPPGRQQFTIGQNKGVIAASYERIKSMIETERDQILYALERGNWKYMGRVVPQNCLNLTLPR